MSQSSYSISVVLPVNNGGQHFVKCLVSLLQASPAPAEIIVVDDGSEDNSLREAKQLGVHVIPTLACEGPAKARNRGAREAIGDILLFIDADVVVPSDFIGKVAEILQREPDLAAVIGSYDDEPGATNFFSRYKNLFHHFTHQQADRQASTFWGACGAMHRKIFLASGGFNESYCRPCIEDIELGYRLTAAGYQIKLVKSLQVKHLKHWGWLSLLKADFFQRALPWTELILRDRRFISDLNLRISSRISVLASYAILGAVFGAVLWPWLFIVAALLGLLLLSLNSRLVLFFINKGGWWFAARALAWHYFYFLYSGLAFAIGTLKYYTRRWNPT